MRPLLKRAVSLLTITTTISVISLTNSASITSVGKRMFSAYNQFATTSQFYLYGRSNCTRTGWEKNVKSYEKPDILAEDYPLDLTGKVFMVTGANAGIGREIVDFLARKGAGVYMVCRNPERAEVAQKDVISKSKNDKVYVLQADCGLETDIRKMWNNFVEHRKEIISKERSIPASDVPDSDVRLDALVCNAGVLNNDKKITEEGVEQTFAIHLLFGTYLLSSLAMSALGNTPDSRLVVVSSGGMYNTKFPKWDVATATGNTPYDGQMAYAYAKRGQVLLCENWAKKYEGKVKVVSCHPGWADSGGVDAAYGSNKRFLEPMRTLWQGAEGIAWLCVADTSKIEGGAYYLDRSPQPKHLSGPFFSEGSYTKNSPAEVEEMMANLELWANNNRPTPEESAVVAALEKPLKATSKAVQTERFMGDWNVLAMIPTIVETSVTNSIEKYEWNEAEKTIRIKFNYVVKDSTQSTNFSFKAKLANPPVNTHWSLSPKVGIYLPLNLSYLILDVADDYSYSIIGVPDRSYVWVMIRALPSQFEKFMIPVTEEYNLAAPAIKKKPAGVVALTAPDDPNAEVSPINIPYSLPTAPAATATDEERKNYEREVLKVAMLKIAELGMDGSKLVRAPWNHELEGK